LVAKSRPCGRGRLAGMLRKFEKNPQDLCLSRTLWKLKDETWGAQGHKERRERDKAPGILRMEPAMTPIGGFMPVGTVLHRQAAAPASPVRLANPAPIDQRAARSSAAWQPSAELGATEEHIKAMFANPGNGMRQDRQRERRA
jgi:hypothetical protein